jgi:hypothetical protein
MMPENTKEKRSVHGSIDVKMRRTMKAMTRLLVDRSGIV